MLRFVFLACAVFSGTPVFLFSVCVFSLLCFFFVLGAGFGTPWRIVGGSHFWPSYRCDLLCLGLLRASGQHRWYFLLVRRPCEGSLPRRVEFVRFSVSGGLSQAPTLQKHIKPSKFTVGLRVLFLVVCCVV